VLPGRMFSVNLLTLMALGLGSSVLGAVPVPARIEAESYAAMAGIQTETCAEGGLNVGWIDPGDFLSFPITVPATGSYTIQYRVAALGAAGVLSANFNGVALGNLAVPATGAWQTWTTISQTVNLNAGTGNLTISAVGGGWNLNWINIVQNPTGVTLPAKIEAEAFASMTGVQTETCAEGGLNVGWIDGGDTLTYALHVPSAGSYQVQYRVASLNGGGSLSASYQGVGLGSLSVPATGAWQSWTTITQTLNLPAGPGNFVITAPSGGWNLNWLNFAVFASSSDVVGKVTVGYQGWFAAPGDGSPINCWWHWAQNWGQSPSMSNKAICSWPDVREYTTTFQTAFANLGNGQGARLFSSYSDQTIDTQFRWMKEYGIDCAALQRFNPNGGEGATRDAMAQKVRIASEARGVKFYIMYDVSNWTSMQSEMKTDWTSKMSALTASSAYARHNGKPVVCIWGFGFNDSARPFTPAQCLDVINWFKGQGCYVIGGVPTWWRTGTGDSRTGFLDVYHAFHMLSPWMVGRTGDVAGADWFYTNAVVPDIADCKARGIDYQPCVMPGDLSNHQRFHGDFMWRQFYNVIRAGCSGIYISMFDEYNEGNQIAKTAEDASQIPAGSGFVTLDEDGVRCSSDYYLRLTGDGGRMLKGQLALTATRPTQPVVSTSQGVVLYQDVQYGGSASSVLAKGRYTTAQLAALGVANDWASSARIPAGWTVILYSSDNFTGTSWTLGSDTVNFLNLAPSANDQLSSCVIQ